jgi:alkylated DNA repair dioxygenase AlkB
LSQNDHGTDFIFHLTMDTLFPMDPVFPKGFLYVRDFITAEEELMLYHEILKTELHTFHFQGYEAKRKVASFGYDYSFEKQALSKGKEIPTSFHSLIEKVARYLSIDKNDFAELLLTEYPIGSVINWHRDAFPFDVIVGISLLSDCTFRLRPHDKMKQGRGSVISFPLRQRSLYVIQGESRTDWQHSISPVKGVRYSITLRTLRRKND